jgi:hypothetical protein
MDICKIDQTGWDSYTGLVGMVPFKDGISERPMTDLEIARIGASIRLVRVDSDEQVGAAVTMVKARGIAAEVKTSHTQVKSETPKAPKELKYDRDALEIVASEGGIKAVREIAKEFDVKGVEINKMIDDILKAQQGTE